MTRLMSCCLQADGAGRVACIDPKTHPGNLCEHQPLLKHFLEHGCPGAALWHAICWQQWGDLLLHFLLLLVERLNDLASVPEYALNLRWPHCPGLVVLSALEYLCHADAGVGSGVRRPSEAKEMPHEAGALEEHPGWRSLARSGSDGVLAAYGPFRSFC